MDTIGIIKHFPVDLANICDLPCEKSYYLNQLLSYSAFHKALKPQTSTVFGGAYQPRAIHSYGGFSGIIPGKLMNGRETVNPLASWIALLDPDQR